LSREFLTFFALFWADVSFHISYILPFYAPDPETSGDGPAVFSKIPGKLELAVMFVV
jgi:hypothetical protein